MESYRSLFVAFFPPRFYPAFGPHLYWLSVAIYYPRLFVYPVAYLPPPAVLRFPVSASDLQYDSYISQTRSVHLWLSILVHFTSQSLSLPHVHLSPLFHPLTRQIHLLVVFFLPQAPTTTTCLTSLPFTSFLFTFHICLLVPPTAPPVRSFFLPLSKLTDPPDLLAALCYLYLPSSTCLIICSPGSPLAFLVVPPTHTDVDSEVQLYMSRLSLALPFPFPCFVLVFFTLLILFQTFR